MNYEPADVRPSSTVDETFGVMSDAHRRYALYYLRDRESTTFDELATALAGWLRARESHAEVVTQDDRERLKTALHHVHLARLREVGFVHYDPTSGEVALGDLPDVADAALDLSLSHERQAAGQRTDTETD